MRAIWKATVIAESDDTVIVERNHYFPIDSVGAEYLKPSDTQSWCPWKGQASYYHVRVDGELNPDAAWYYAEPKTKAAQIKGHIAFWKGVEVLP